MLLLQGFEVAVVDHVGADLIAERDGHKLAVSVKTRLFRAGSTEHRSVSIDDDHLRKLVAFADRFDMSPAVAYVLSIAGHKVIHVLLMPLEQLKAHLPRVSGGYVLRVHKDIDMARLTRNEGFGYACLKESEFRRLPAAVTAALAEPRATT